MPPRLTVVGSINLDLIAQTARLPHPGETVTGATFSRACGGKGANQAVAAARLGAEVTMIGAVGQDDFSAAALEGLMGAGVDLRLVRRTDKPTGVALITIDALGENEIVVAPGANLALAPEHVDLAGADAVLCQLEIPIETVRYVSRTAQRFFLNAAPAVETVPPAELTIVNRYEFDSLTRHDGAIVVTLGAEGAVLLQDGRQVARATPPPVTAIDGTAAGDAFTACLVVSILEGRELVESLHRACIAGALTASRLGAQTSLPTAAEVDALL